MHITSLQKLISIAGPALGPNVAVDSMNLASVPDNVRALFALRNGFFAFESALHVFSVCMPDPATSGYDFETWNSVDLWKSEFGDITCGLCFAEDVFGCQWFTSGSDIRSFDPETGDYKVVAATIEDWADIVLQNYKLHTAWPLAHNWQTMNRPLQPNERLVPIKLFVLGGEFAIDNLCAMDAVQGMRYRAEIARQIKDWPDGTHVKIELK